ncbi:glucosaminidase domain-containing protein [Fluviicola taffensis]|uniref:Peptidoglycan hydrolase n=1 Tax=Fluviicola taffensis (strain DSM 16823 / NCIMB 13979 / RW262) TaxID=755732 RepID=F2IDC1_FLUTR|nr:glucosaminidase domain-containing protein [Fluviicola taffensis]AEA45536.1 Mannosyl-glycoprotein endo-beta-N-acetylglucosamidase [Fluviicola taffensis DSM 16823]
MKSLAIVGIGFSFFSFGGEIQAKTSQTDYVNLWSNVAVEQMIIHRIPASITLAQGLLESGNGNSPLAVEANNHFGIKCSDWTGEKIYFDDDAKGECFRKYPTATDSYNDHSLFLTKKPRYAGLFQFPTDDYKSWAKGLKKAGYATHPEYAEKLIDLIERLKLYEYDDKTAPANQGTELLATAVKDSKDSKVKPKTSSTKETNSSMKIDESCLKYQAHIAKENKNDVKYILARKGDTYYKIAKEYDLAMWQMYKYNNFVDKKDLLEEGDIVYLEPKRNRSRTKGATFVAKKDITLIEVSQNEGIKLKKLVKMNGFTSDKVTVQKGQKILLR